MTIKGVIVDISSGKNIDAIVSVLRDGMNVLTLTTIDGQFIIEDLLSTDSLRISAPDYPTSTWFARDLDSTNENVFILKKNGASVLPVVLIAVGSMMLLKKKSKVSGVTAGDVTAWAMIGAGVLGFSFLRQFLEKLGIWDNRDTKDLDADATNPNSPWSPNYWRNKPANIPFTYTIDVATAKSYAKQLYDAFGPFNDCEGCAKSVVRKLRTKANLSFLAEIFSQQYGQDLLSFLRGGNWPQDRLSDSDVNELNKYVNNLQDY